MPKKKGQSLSELVENYFKLISVDRREIKPEELSPQIRRLRGINKIDENLDYKQILTEELEKNMISKLFPDSGVVIDFFTDREPFANPASEMFDLNEKGKSRLYLSAVSINNIYYIVKKYLGIKRQSK